MRERLIEILPPERRRHLHLTLAEYLETSRRADADAIAHHYEAAERPERAVAWMREAARAATAALAFARAAELYGRAAALAVDPDERVALAIDHADAMVLAGRRGEAGRACLEACELARRHGLDRRVAELRALAGEHFMLGGNFVRGAELFREALAAIDLIFPDSVEATVTQTLALTGALVARGFEFARREAAEVSAAAGRRVDLQLTAARALAQSDIRAPWVATIALRDALELGDPRRVQRAFAYYAFVNSSRLADHPLGELILGRAEGLARELEDDEGLAWAVLSRAFILLYRREVERSFALMQDAERRFLTLTRPLEREAGIARIGLLTLCGNYGYDLPFARAARHGWIGEALEREDLTPVTWLRLMGVWVDLASDDVAAARENLRLAREAWAGVVDEIFTGASIMAELGIALYAEPASAWEASERIAGVLARMFASKVPAMQHAFHRHRSAAALCAHAAGVATRAETIARVAACAEGLEGNASAVDTLALVRGHLAALRGDVPEASRLFTEAAEGYGRRSQRTLELLVLLCRARATGGPAEAIVAELVALGVVAPERYCAVYAGVAVPPRADA